jgi:hypothetical protein
VRIRGSRESGAVENQGQSRIRGSRELEAVTNYGTQESADALESAHTSLHTRVGACTQDRKYFRWWRSRIKGSRESEANLINMINPLTHWSRIRGSRESEAVENQRQSRIRDSHKPWHTGATTRTQIENILDAWVANAKDFVFGCFKCKMF